MAKKRGREFSDTVIVILLVAVIIVSFIGSILVYKTVSETKFDSPPINIVEQKGAIADGATGMVSIIVTDSDSQSNTPSGGDLG